MPEPQYDPFDRSPEPVALPAPDSLIGQAPRMMRGGMVGSHALLLAVALMAWLAGGSQAAMTTLLAGLTVSVLMIAGQWLQMVLVQRADAMGMAGTLAGFGIRVAALGAGLALWLAFADSHPMIRPWGVLAGCCAVSLGWLAGVLVTYSRLRVPIYDVVEDAADDPRPGPGEHGDVNPVTPQAGGVRTDAGTAHPDGPLR